LSSWFIFNQQLPQLSQFSTNLDIFNPSAIGLNEKSCISIGGRWQMLGFGSEPRSLFLSGSTKLPSVNKKREINSGLRIDENETNVDTISESALSHSLGGQFIHDQYGAFGRSGITGNYSLGINLNNDWRAHLGARFGWSNFSFNQDKAQVLNVNDPSQIYQGGDDEYDQFIGGTNRRNSFDLGLGVTIVNDNFLLGLAMNQITKSYLDVPMSSTAFFDQRMHWNLFTGYTYKIPEVCDIQGMLLVKKMQPTPLSLEVSLRTLFPNSLWAGIHYRNRSSVGIMGGFLIYEKFHLGYSIDFETTSIRKFSNGGHEIILNYRFGE
jgi:type IX secretion system PorP/SprF family membrane protein